MRKKINKTKSVTNSIQLVISYAAKQFSSFFSILYLFTNSKYKYQSTNLQSFYSLQHKCYVSIKATRSQSDDFEHYKMFQLYKLLGILSEMKCADSETSKIIVSKMPFQLVKNQPDPLLYYKIIILQYHSGRPKLQIKGRLDKPTLRLMKFCS